MAQASQAKPAALAHSRNLVIEVKNLRAQTSEGPKTKSKVIF